jgi:hypothetical protein
VHGYGSAFSKDSNIKGQVVGYSETYVVGASLGLCAFLWSNNNLQDRNDLVSAGILGGQTLTRAVGIGDKSEIVANGTKDGEGNRAFLLNPIADEPLETPEPAAFGLPGVGLAGIAPSLRCCV